MGAFSGLKALATPNVIDDLCPFRAYLTGRFYGAHLALFASKTLFQIRHPDDQKRHPK
jgi:hypothetical protein